MTTVSVAIPHVPIRKTYLERSLKSVMDQTRPADEIHVVVDNDHRGPAHTRNKALFASTSEWTLFLDDDDELEPTAIEDLVACAEATQADIVYPWFTIRGLLGKDSRTGKNIYAGDPFPEMFGREFDPSELEHRNFIPITTLVRTELAKSIGGIPAPNSPEWPHDTNEDWGFWRQMVAAEAKFVHLPKRLWKWHIHHTDKGFPHYTGTTW